MLYLLCIITVYDTCLHNCRLCCYQSPSIYAVSISFDHVKLSFSLTSNGRCDWRHSRHCPLQLIPDDYLHSMHSCRPCFWDAVCHTKACVLQDIICWMNIDSDIDSNGHAKVSTKIGYMWCKLHRYVFVTVNGVARANTARRISICYSIDQINQIKKPKTRVQGTILTS